MEVLSIRVASRLVIMGLAKVLWYKIWMWIPGVWHWICWRIAAQVSSFWGIAIWSGVPKKRTQCFKMAPVIILGASSVWMVNWVYLVWASVMHKMNVSPLSANPTGPNRSM